MNKEQALALFESYSIRRICDEPSETWFFSVVDVVAALTDSVNPRDYWFKMKIRVNTEGGLELSTICRQLKMRAPDVDGPGFAIPDPVPRICDPIRPPDRGSRPPGNTARDSISRPIAPAPSPFASFAPIRAIRDSEPLNPLNPLNPQSTQVDFVQRCLEFIRRKAASSRRTPNPHLSLPFRASAPSAPSRLPLPSLLSTFNFALSTSREQHFPKTPHSVPVPKCREVVL